MSYRKAKRTGMRRDMEKYKTMRNMVVRLLRQSKKSYFKTLGKCGSKSSGTVKQLRKTSKGIPTLKTTSSEASTSIGKATLLNEVFTQNFNSALPPLTQADWQSIHADPSLCPDGLLCTDDEVLGLLLSTDTSKASGPDGVSCQMLKATAHAIAPILTRLFNQSVKSGMLPTKWKLSSVVQIPKKADSSSEPNDYRPISLLPVVSKLLERHIHSLVTEHLQTNGLLSDAQWGFTPGKSTTIALISVFHDILQLADRGKDIGLVFFDFRKAFDSVPHKPLLNKLKDIGLNDYLLRWICNYLYNRHQYVVVDGESSPPTQVLSGVPQGSVLGPLLFLIYIEGQPHSW